MDERRSVNLNYLDLFVVFLIVWMFISVIQDPEKEDAGPEQKAEFLIQLDWDNEASSDIDLWTGIPSGDVIWFGSRQANIGSLARDDLGRRNDTYTAADGSLQTILVNQEIVTLRAVQPGRYHVNVHSYSFSDSHPLTATVKLIRLNPYRVEVTHQVTIDTRGQQLAAMSFTIDESGKVVNVGYEFVNLTGMR